MKRSYVIGAVATLAIGLLVAWIARNTYWEEYEDQGFPQGEALTNPFYAAQHLAELLGARTQARHDVVRLPPLDAVMVVGDWNWNLIPERRARLEKWVHDGGRLLVSSNLLADEMFDTWTGVRQKYTSGEPGQFKQCRRSTDCPRPKVMPQPAQGSTTGRTFNICHLTGMTYLATTRATSWRLHDNSGHAQVVRVPIGRGSVTIVNTVPFTYQTLLCDDNPRFFVAATQLRKGIQLDFLSEDGNASLLSLTWRYGSPAIVLTGLLIVLWLWRSGARFGPLVARAESARRSLAEQIRGTGQFTLRCGGGRALYAASLRALNEAAARRVPRYAQLPAEERIAILAPLTGFGPGELSAALATGARGPHELRKAIAVLETARRQIADKLR